MIGQRVGMLTCLSVSKNRKIRKTWTEVLHIFQCDCGERIERRITDVKRSKNPSCGCNRKQGEDSAAQIIFKKNYADGDLTFLEFKELASKDCFYCGKPPSNKEKTRAGAAFIYSGLDRLDNAKPHDKSNCVPSCWPCNSLKGYRDMDQFLNLVDAIWIHRNGAANDSIGAIR